MSQARVRELLGEPEKISASSPLVFWHYPGTRPFGAGQVTFDDKGVYGWDEPQWQLK